MKNRDKCRCNLRPTFLQLSLQLYRTSIQPSVTKEKNFLKRATFNPFSAQRVEIHLTLFSMLRKPFNFYQRSSNATHHIHPLKGSHQKNHPFFRTLSLSWTVSDIRGATCISDVVFYISWTSNSSKIVIHTSKGNWNLKNFADDFLFGFSPLWNEMMTMQKWVAHPILFCKNIKR